MARATAAASPEFEAIMNAWRREWPAAIHLPKITDLSGGIIHHKTLANALSCGTGPEGTARFGRKVMLSREGVIEWARKRAEAGFIQHRIEK